MEKIKLHIQELIKEHEESAFCTEYEQAENETDPQTSLMCAYDCGQYELLKQLLDDIDTLQAHKDGETF